MATKKKLLQAAAGSAGGAAALNVEDVFSTTLWTGTNNDQKGLGIHNGIALGSFGAGSSTYFDGTEYAVRKTSALTGVSGSKTLTYSGWIQFKNNPINSWASVSFNGFYFMIYGNENQLIFIGRNSSNTNVFYGEINGISPRLFNNGEWYHILISADLTNSSNRHVYINDVAQSVTWNTYTNDNIDFTQTSISVGNRDTSGYNIPHYQAHLYLDFTYRDLSVTSNRRLFIDADGGSTSASSLAALNPILYLPMIDGYAIGKNAGTGGDFSDNGGASINTKFGTEYDSTVGQGGAVFIKSRSAALSTIVHDTERSASTKYLLTTSTNAEANDNDSIQKFTADGFVLGSWVHNTQSGEYASWTFRKAPKFFDVVEFTYTGSAQISHNLGGKIGAIIMKRTDAAQDWLGWFYRGASAGSGYYLSLNTTEANAGARADTEHSDTYFNPLYVRGANSSGTVSPVSGGTYVAYLFAHNDGDGDFGPDGDADIIKCGSFTSDGSSDYDIDLGFEPQLLIVKRATGGTGNWFIQDNMREFSVDRSDILYPNLSNAEGNYVANYIPSSTGFGVRNGVPSGDYIYIAIRRGPMAVPTDATDVFDAEITTSGGKITTGFVTDMSISNLRSSSTSYNSSVADRLRGNNDRLLTSSNAAEQYSSGMFLWDYNDGMYNDIGGSNQINWMWKRAPNYFDVVAYTGNGSTQTISHNLGVAPELIITKRRDSTQSWGVGVPSINSGQGYLKLESSDPLAATTYTVWSNISASSYDVGADGITNTSGGTYIAYLFASLDGISKVGSYTGDGTAGKVIDCGFSSGARFVLIKKTSGTGGWFVYDTERGIVSGNDPYLWLDSTNAENTSTDSIDPHSSGFAVNYANTNANGATYIFYAIA